ncbi:tape measure protein [Paracoccus shanxieyensis]|uniref:Tape measure protein n=1 Tax=Paracoccus shanxieyensis TaxID=2675752 RepID=A0A6L6IWY9_9RHOB|nr:tape measure protein [Paracoccus shanxieyensis]MTH64723.1 tape measure protein [Paracoccus shanxieyensis]MTH87867.1 tape measure protein [Paracoccus shanxieyensis]
MEDLARIGFKAETSQLLKAKRDLDNLGPAAQRAESFTQKLEKRFAQMDAQTAALGTRMRAATGILKSFAIGFAGAFSVSALSGLSDKFTALSNTLKVVAGGQGDVNALMSELNGIASRTRAPLGATVELYQRLSIAGKELGASQSQMMRFTENIGLALAQQGGSAEQASGALFQLSQALGGSVVRAEEFNSIVEGAYPIALAAARGIDEAGGSVAKLRQMMLDGKLTSGEFFNAILSQTDELEAAFAKTTPTIGQALGRLGEEFMLTVGRFNELTGASGGVASAILFAANHLREFAVYAGVAGAAVAATYIPALWGIVSSAYAAVAAMVTLRGALIATGIGAVVVLVGTLINAFITLTERVGGVGKAFTFLGELAGAVWQGIADSAQAIPPALSGVWAKVKSEFYLFVSDLSFKWADFLTMFKVGVEGLGFGELANSLASGPIMNATAAGNDALVASMEAATVANTKLAEAAGMVNEAFGPARDKLAELQTTVDDVTGSAGRSTDAVAGLGGALDQAGGAAGKAAEKITELQRITDEISLLSEPFDQASRAFDVLTQARDNAIIGNDAFAESLGRIQAAFLATGGTAEQWGKIVQGQTASVGAQLEELAKQDVVALGTSFADLAVGGKANFADMAKSIIKNLLDIAIQALIIKPLLGAMGIPFAAGGTFGGDVMTASLQGAGLNAVQPAPFARGGTFYGGGQVEAFANGGAFTNGLFDSPTPFKFAQGGGFALGVMGEAGPEAVMPLTRGPDGSLGVQMYGGGAGGAAVASGSMSGQLELIVRAEEGDMFRPTVEVIAKDQATNIVVQGMSEMNDQLPDRLEQIEADRRAR